MQHTRLSGNVGHPDHILANPIISHKAEPRPGSGEIWLAATKHDGAQFRLVRGLVRHRRWLKVP